MDAGADIIPRSEEKKEKVATLMVEVNSRMNWWERKLGVTALLWERNQEACGPHTHACGLECGGRV